jgi:hypothetical protein
MNTRERKKNQQKNFKERRKNISKRERISQQKTEQKKM